MKIRITLAALAIVLLSAVGTQAQTQGDIRVNGGMTYLFKPYDSDGRIGFGFGAEYLVIDNLSIAPSYYLTNKDDVKLNLLNIDVRYYFTQDAVQVYGVAGYQSATAKFGGSSSTEGGIASGAGGIFAISDNFGINAELKYSFIKPGDDALGLLGNVGVVYTF